MTAFQSARAVEAEGMAILLPYLEERSDRLVLTSKGALAKHLQLIAGDVLMNTANDRVWSVEIKVERNFRGNLFLETWSNRNLDSRASHAERGSNPGWMMHSRADLLMYYFLDSDDLYTINLFELQRWAFTASDDKEHYPRICEFPEKKQGKYVQANDTWGRCVPVKTLASQLRGFRHCKVKQLSFLEAAA